jgi:hypothetical protein
MKNYKIRLQRISQPLNNLAQKNMPRSQAHRLNDGILKVNHCRWAITL